MPVIMSQPSGDAEVDTTVNFTAVSLSKTSWTIQDFNLFIVDSDLPNVNLFLKEKVSTQTHARKIHVENSAFGHMNIRGGYNIRMSDCAVDGATVMSNATLLDVVGGTLSVSNSSFQHLGGGVIEVPWLLKAVGCRIHMMGVNCSNNEAPGGLIQIQNGSELFLHNSTFMNNGFDRFSSSVISVKTNSSLSISHSVFSENIASNGSCLWLHHNVSVTINQSTFLNNGAQYGGVIYQSHEAQNTFDQNHSYKQHSVHLTQNDFFGEGKRQQALSIYDSYFVNNFASRNGVVYLCGASHVLFVKKCNFTRNQAFDHSGVIHAESLSGTVVLEQCLFTNNSVIRNNGDSLSLIGTHSQLMACEFLGSAIPSFHRSTVNFRFGTSSINNCTFSEQTTSSIGAYGSKLNITDSRCYGHKKHCLYWANCMITIVGSQFNAYAKYFLYIANMNWSNLTVINTSFMNGHSIFTSIFRSGQVQFINCSFHTSGGLVLGTDTLLKNCTISNLKEQFILAGPLNQIPDLADPTGPAHLEIVDCVIVENNVPGDQPFIYVTDVSFVMTNCLYSGNYVRNHIMLKLNGTTDVTIKNVTFFNNSVGGYYDSENDMSLLTVTNTGINTSNLKSKIYK